MYRKRYSLLAAAMVCVALALLSTPRLADAEGPETVEITFALEVPCDPFWEEPPPELSDFVGDDTVVIMTRTLFETAHSLIFDGLSPPCGDYPVAGTRWRLHARGTVLNVGEQIDAKIYSNLPPAPPAHYPLLFKKITDEQSCWLKIDGNGQAVAQEDWDLNTSAVFIIVTGEFRVKH
jgi:hypothetical protein